LNHKSQITAGVRESECRTLLQNFLAEQRAKNPGGSPPLN